MSSHQHSKKECVVLACIHGLGSSVPQMTWCKPVSKSHYPATARVGALCKHVMMSHHIVDTNQKFCSLKVGATCLCDGIG